MLNRNSAHFRKTRVKTSLFGIFWEGEGGSRGRETWKGIFCLNKSLRNKFWGNEFKGLSQTLPVQVQGINYISYCAFLRPHSHTLRRTPDFHNKPLNPRWRGGITGAFRRGNNLLHQESAMNRPLKINLVGFKYNGLYIWEWPAPHTYCVKWVSQNSHFNVLFHLLLPGFILLSDD